MSASTLDPLFDNTQTETNEDHFDPLDVFRPWPASKPNKIGAPRIEFLDKVVEEVYRITDVPHTKRHKCRGEGCGYSGANRSQRRIYRHACRCGKLPDELRREVWAKRVEMGDVSESEDEGEDGEEKGEAVKTRRGRVAAVKSKKPDGMVGKLLEKGVQLTRQQRHRKADRKLVYLFCVGGLATHVSQLDVFIDFCHGLDSTYHVPNRTEIEEDLIVLEQVRVMTSNLKELEDEEDMTISADGGTTKGTKEAYWTVHVSTVKRKVYLLECQEATAVSHSAEWIRDLVLKVRLLCSLSRLVVY